MSQNQETSIERPYKEWMMTSLQKAQKMENQISLASLQNVDAKIGHQHHRKRGIKNRTWPYKKTKRKKKIFVKVEDFKMHHSAG